MNCMDPRTVPKPYLKTKPPSVSMRKLCYSGLLLLVFQVTLAQTPWQVSEFAMPLNQIVSAPEQQWVNRGCTTVRPVLHTVCGVRDFVLPPFSANGLSLSVTFTANGHTSADLGDFKSDNSIYMVDLSPRLDGSLWLNPQPSADRALTIPDLTWNGQRYHLTLSRRQCRIEKNGLLLYSGYPKKYNCYLPSQLSPFRQTGPYCCLLGRAWRTTSPRRAKLGSVDRAKPRHRPNPGAAS